MSNEARKELLLEGLDCAHCAAAIEDSVRKLSGVRAAAMNFATKTLTIDADGADDIDGIVRHTGEIIRNIEPTVTVQEKVISKPARKALVLMGLDCGHCAALIEKKVKALPGVTDASVDVVSKKLIINARSRRELDGIVQQASEIARQVESGIDVVAEAQPAARAEAEKTERTKLYLAGVGAVLFAAALLFSFPFWVEFGVFFASYLLVGGEVLLKAGRNLIRGRLFDENFLMSVATIGAFAIGQFPEGVAVMLFYQVGEFFQQLAVNRSRKSIAALMNIRPDYANLKAGGELVRADPDEVHIGDTIVVKPGEKVPLDGRVTEGRSALDVSALTGESVPREVAPGDDILSGAINKNGLLTVEVTKEFGESTVSKILELVQNAGSKKARTENFITKFAGYYTPAVVIVAVLLALVPPLAVPGATFSDWINRALVFLVVSCPCALVISIPLGFFGGIGGASKGGILVKGSNYLEALNSVDTVVFDKTGTLTKGRFEVTGIKCAENVGEADLLESAAYAESYSTHPIALSIVKAYGRDIDRGEISQFDEISGHGIKAAAKGRLIVAGNDKLMAREQIPFEQAGEPGTIVYVAVDGAYAGYIVISDQVKDDSKGAIAALRKLGVKKLVMLTGDSKAVGDRIGRELGLDEVHAELLPDGKVAELERLEAAKARGGKLVFVGDGINDAPVLARADVGVAMGGVGSDAAIEAADVVIMNDEPSRLAAAIKIARRTRRIVWQNIIFALAVKAVVLALGAGGLASIWEAVFADVGVALLAVLNAMRALKTKNL
ncbi:Cd2+/Zn2+-exporting ATPase [Sporobacter termitidis DSM 10068]|uniref:Cd2+/Zn2+-exporting ATPase n=1 Tax=Sporobacter termitidis DSM 10068 TaxID=1123282 RepID=A0A1M5ZEF1_9FIRM|nr:heavy metal translocating P-type ATPase [Sporobacter termitidis]SHI22551.1 Cd2+/Zn2+-exporting ATPase [Sporobacter termitidis DSM 10068]